VNEFTQCLVGFMLLLYKFSVLCFLFHLSSFFVLSPMLPVSVDSLLMIALSDLFNIYLVPLVQHQLIIFIFICMFCRSLFVILYFFFWPLCFLFVFDYGFWLPLSYLQTFLSLDISNSRLLERWMDVVLYLYVCADIATARLMLL
jgi:hypothetical protein